MERDVRISAWCHSDYIADLRKSPDLYNVDNIFVNGKIFQNVQLSHMVSPGNSTYLPSYTHLKNSQFTLER